MQKVVLEAIAENPGIKIRSLVRLVLERCPVEETEEGEGVYTQPRDVGSELWELWQDGCVRMKQSNGKSQRRYWITNLGRSRL